MGYLINMFMVYLQLTDLQAETPAVNGFAYTRCNWINYKCESRETEAVIKGREYSSEWPPGPYALFTPIQGCPESEAKGWSDGYLKFTWQEPHTVITATTCETNMTTSQYDKDKDDTVERADNMNTSQYDKDKNDTVERADNMTTSQYDKDSDGAVEAVNASQSFKCLHKVTSYPWPDTQSNLLGPFSNYALRLNFCFKARNDFPVRDVSGWPAGSYSIFGDESPCPQEFESTEKVIQLPAITSWTSNGRLPYFRVVKAGDTVILTLKLCVRLNGGTDFINQTIYTTPFIVIKNENRSCPEIREHVVLRESLLLETGDNGTPGLTPIFDFCYYRPLTWLNTLNAEYTPQNVSSKSRAFTVSNPSRTYGSVETRMNSVNQCSGCMTHTSIPLEASEYTSWLLLDLGRTVAIAGIHFKNNYSFNHHEGQFNRYYISQNRWIPVSGAISCAYIPQYMWDSLYIDFLRDMDGRYVKIVGKVGTHRIPVKLDVLTREHFFTDDSRNCNTDLGMADGSIQDTQLSTSSFDSQSTPASARPFSSGWCAAKTDRNPHITIDMITATKFEGITVFNGGHVQDSMLGIKYTQTFVPMGSRTVVVSYSSDINDTSSEIYTNETFNVDMFLSSNDPQTFFHDSITARYVKIYIKQSMNPPIYCIRFELHGCRNQDTLDLPQLVEATLTQGSTNENNENKTQYQTIANLQILKQASVITSIGFPAYYRGGVTYTWIIDFPRHAYINMIFTDVSFNSYPATLGAIESACEDRLVVTDKYSVGTGLYIDNRFNSMISRLETKAFYVVMTFTSCHPASEKIVQGTGFKVHVGSQVAPSCFSLHDDTALPGERREYCSLPMMHLSSLSRFNIVHSHLQEIWTIHIKRRYFHLYFTKFNVRCDSGSSLTISDRFTANKTFCNLKMIPTHIYSESDTMIIQFEEGSVLTPKGWSRTVAREGFNATYISMKNSQRIYARVLRKPILPNDPKDVGIELLLADIRASEKDMMFPFSTRSDAYERIVIHLELIVARDDKGRDHVWPHTPRRAYKACSRTFEKCYSIFSGSSTSWHEASGECWIRKKRLVSIHSEVEQQLLKYIMRNFQYVEMGNDTLETAFSKEDADPVYYVHIGLARTTSDAGTLSHVWQDGSPVTYAAWSRNEPTSIGECTRMSFHLAHTNNTWESEHCDNGRSNYFVCEEHVPDALLNKEPPDGIQLHPYAGHLSRTSSGRTCQRWNSTKPHMHLYNSTDFFDKNMEDLENYCAAPAGSSTLWCHTTAPGMRWDTCNLLDTASDRCYSTHYSYAGKWNTSQSGKSCQIWTSQYPNKHEIFLDSQFPDGTVIDAFNYCRDPNDEGFLWCFTTDHATRSEACLFEYKFQVSDDVAAVNELSDKNGDTMPMRYRCNGIPNCADASDETHCVREVHKLLLNRTTQYEITVPDTRISLFQCNTSLEWISILARCDNIVDCIDASDETNCFISNADVECSKEKFACGDGSCIHISQMCDFIVDCIDESDELCEYRLCSKEEYRCNNQQCIPMERKCDAYEQCLDGTDEHVCDLCKEGAFHCDRVRCIPNRLVCDKYPDCKDESDERSCTQSVLASCKEWWKAGYRTTGVYNLNGTEAECNFDTVFNDATIYTIFRNIEISRVQLKMARIHSKELEMLDDALLNILQNTDYNCTQNITQTCNPAEQAAADKSDLFLNGDVQECSCIIMTVTPFGYSDNNQSIHYCDDAQLTITEMDRVLFEYIENRNKMRDISLNVNTTRIGIEITPGPIMCAQNIDVGEATVSCENGNKTFPASVKCVYDTDSAGFIIGCRSGLHLQGCESFECPANTVKCPGSFCLPLKFICDTEIQCPGGQDEQDCGCHDKALEVILLHEVEENGRHSDDKLMKRVANQFHTTNSIVRELKFHSRKHPSMLEFEHSILDISDTEVDPHDTTNNAFTCNYSMMASDFINSIQFSKTTSRGIIFIQKSNESENVAKLMFGNIKSMPDFRLYRVMQDPRTTPPIAYTFPFVIDVFVKRWNILSSVGVNYFPELCSGCHDEALEVIIIYEVEDTDDKLMKRVANKFHTANSIVRELKFHSRTHSEIQGFEHRILDISDTKVDPHDTTSNAISCNYSIMASDFINSIQFTKNTSRGIIFIQKSNESETVAKLMFGNINSMPDVRLYRVMQDPRTTPPIADTFPFVIDVFVKRWNSLSSIGVNYFPELCSEAPMVHCPLAYRCLSTKMCIPLQQVCDGHVQCLFGDDERLCISSCPANCTCNGYSTDCSFSAIDTNSLVELHEQSRLIDLSGNPDLKEIIHQIKFDFPNLISLNLSQCEIKDIGSNRFKLLNNLRILDLSYNKLSKLPSSAFIGLRRLTSLVLLGNTDIHTVEAYALKGLLSLRNIEIRGSNINSMSSQAFAGLRLDRLYLANNTIRDMEDNVFGELETKTIDIESNNIINFHKGLFVGVSGLISLRTPDYKYCCVRPNYLPESRCLPAPDEFSSCEDLLRLSVLQTMMWLIGICALVGNIFSITYRVVYDREKLQLGYGMFVTNLAVADFLMGVYLIIIATADAVFRKRYIFVDEFWRNSAWCTFAGFLSTLSSEASVFFICLITLDRLLVIKYPFGQVRFSSRNVAIASLSAWMISFSIAFTPIIYDGYFRNRFYSKAGVCIALPLTRDRPPGWLYSILVFIGLNFITFCLIAIGQMSIYMEIKKTSSRMRLASPNTGNTWSRRQRELRVAKNLLLVVTTDFLCWFPIGCMAMMALFGHEISGDVYAWTAVFVLPINSALNPVLYTLTAVIGKKKPQTRREETPVVSTLQLKNRPPLNGLFRYFISRKERIGQAYISLDDLVHTDMILTTDVALKLVLQLTRCLHLLQRHSMRIAKLSSGSVYVSTECGKIVGDIQIRQEPVLCFDSEKMSDDIYKFGIILRGVLRRLQNKKRN